ncbi:hypothetical protein BGY98DRAFT_937279 [Russula aff. rugulosa BPL654]|nr:hypothetical protein BGY98DRAFT_937279 [Russula aff. rugulosa BPL654]
MWTPLHTASACGALEVVRLLLERGADVETKNNDGKTAFQEAAERGREEVKYYRIVSFLLLMLLLSCNSSSVSEYSAGMAVRGSRPRSHWEQDEVGRATSIRRKRSESGMVAAICASGAHVLL